MWNPAEQHTTSRAREELTRSAAVTDAGTDPPSVKEHNQSHRIITDHHKPSQGPATVRASKTRQQELASTQPSCPSASHIFDRAPATLSSRNKREQVRMKTSLPSSNVATGLRPFSRASSSDGPGARGSASCPRYGSARYAGARQLPRSSTA